MCLKFLGNVQIVSMHNGGVYSSPTHTFLAPHDFSVIFAN
jgi:hypothetical protein